MLWPANPGELDLPRVVVEVPFTGPIQPADVDTVLAGDSMNAIGNELVNVQQRVQALAEHDDHGVAMASPGEATAATFRRIYQRDTRDAAHDFLLAADVLNVDAMVRNATFNPRDVVVDEQDIELLHEVARLHQRRIRIVRESRAAAQAHAVEQLARTDGLHRIADAREHLSAADRQTIEEQARAIADRYNVTIERARLGLETDLLADALSADASFYFGGEAYFAPQGSVNPGLRRFDECREFLAMEMFGDVLAVFLHAGALSRGEAVQAYERVMARAGNGASGG